MVSVPVRTADGQLSGRVCEFEVSFEGDGPNHRLIHQAYCMYRSNLRLGTAKTKSRAEVVGSSKKLFKQKGTGNARMGNKRTPVRRGGGHCFAKRPRDWHYRLPAKMLKRATREVLAAKLVEEKVVLIDSFSLAAPSTKSVAKALQGVGVAGGRVLIASNEVAGNIHKSSRNIPNCRAVPVLELNCYSLLHASSLVVTEDSVPGLKKLLG